jgi:hypothetical protein
MSTLHVAINLKKVTSCIYKSSDDFDEVCYSMAGAQASKRYYYLIINIDSNREAGASQIRVEFERPEKLFELYKGIKERIGEKYVVDINVEKNEFSFESFREV